MSWKRGNDDERYGATEYVLLFTNSVGLSIYKNFVLKINNAGICESA